MVHGKHNGKPELGAVKILWLSSRLSFHLTNLMSRSTCMRFNVLPHLHQIRHRFHKLNVPSGSSTRLHSRFQLKHAQITGECLRLRCVRCDDVQGKAKELKEHHPHYPSVLTTCFSSLLQDTEKS